MAFLPFYIPTQKRLKVVIVGGGYAGMAALTVLAHYASNIDIIIIDPRKQHIKITHLHETFRYPLSDMLVPFSVLEQRFGCHHICATPSLDEGLLQQWQKDKTLVVNGEELAFDYLLIASSCEAKASEPMENVLILEDFASTAGSDLLNNFLIKNKNKEQSISVVGGGATGIQFLFEIKQFLDRQKINSKLRLINSGERVLEQFPAGFSSYVQSRMRDLGIDFYPNTYFKEQQSNKILLEEKQARKQFELLSDISILFLGKKQKKLLVANTFGQVMINHILLHNIFVAGDCSHYNSFGSNTLTAQSAVRKGKLVARNILRHSGVLKLLEPYLHRDIGYVVSLGSADAVGWLVSEGNVITGIPALAIKELVEAQYDFLLMGIDTYLV